jgi:hypothetical protein
MKTEIKYPRNVEIYYIHKEKLPRNGFHNRKNQVIYIHQVFYKQNYYHPLQNPMF